MNNKKVIDTRTVAEIIGDHSNFLNLEVVIFYAKFKDTNYAHNAYIYSMYTCMYGPVVCIIVIFKLRRK